MKWGIFCLFERYETSTAKAIEDQMSLVEYADTLTFDEIWFAEHHFNDFSICPSPSLLLANASHRTHHARLGCAGFLAPFYDAIRLSEEVATLDILSNGRINLGLAKGAFAPDSKHFNITVEHLRPMLLESTKAIHALLHVKDKPVSFNGQYIHFSEVDIEPKCIQETVPIYIATFESDETIAFAAKNGFGLMLSQGISLEECERVSQYYISVAGYTPHIILLRTFLAAHSTQEAQEKAKPAIDHFAKSMRAASSFNKSPCFDKERYAKLIKERDTFFDGQKFFDNGIIGDIQECIDKLLLIKRRLLNVHVVFKFLGTNVAENKALMDFFQQHIRPHVEKVTDV